MLGWGRFDRSVDLRAIIPSGCKGEVLSLLELNVLRNGIDEFVISALCSVNVERGCLRG